MNTLLNISGLKSTRAALFAGCLGLFAVVVSSAHADRLHFTDGESIPGTLISIGDGQVHWSSGMLGELMIEQHHVSLIESEEPFDLKKSGETLNSCTMLVQREQQKLLCVQGLESLSNWKLVVSAGVSEAEPLPVLAQEGNLKIAAENSSGNNSITKYDIDSRLKLRYIESRHTLALRYQEESAEDTTTRNMWRTSYQYDQFFTEQWFATGNAFYEEDKFKELDERSSAGLGLGYQFLETSYVNLLGKTTLNYVDEKFSNGVQRSTPAFLWNLDLAWRFNQQGMEFYHRHAVLQKFDDSQDYELTTLTGFKYPINGHFSSVIQLEYGYDNLPAEDTIDKKDQTWSLGLNYDW